MKSPQVPVAKEGIPFIGLSALATVILALLDLKIPSLLFLLITAFVLYFFRDPDRIIPTKKNLVVSPADGKVISIEKADDPFFENGDTVRVSIFMNIFNCHVNRAPISGEVIDLKYKPGRFLSADKPKAALENERLALFLRDDFGRKLIVVQVAGLIARRIVCFAEKGDRLSRGERFGMIRFGSRLDVYLPKDAHILVNRGEKVFSGQSVIASFSDINEA